MKQGVFSINIEFKFDNYAFLELKGGALNNGVFLKQVFWYLFDCLTGDSYFRRIIFGLWFSVIHYGLLKKHAARSKVS